MNSPDPTSSLFAWHAAYHPRTPWRIWAAIGMSVAVLAASALVLFAGVAISLVMHGGMFDASQTGSVAPPSQDTMMVLSLPAMFAAQLTAAVGFWLLAGQQGGNRIRVLALEQPRDGWRAYVFGVVVFLVAALAIGAAIDAALPHDQMIDLKPMLPLMNSSLWPLTLLMLTVGAALSEEFMFRGFLFSAMAQTRLGLVGTTIVTSALWAAMHGYSLQGALTIFALGLVLSAILIRTGSLLVPMLCHAAYNGLVFVVARNIAMTQPEAAWISFFNW
jgi:uncharacterized protein